MVIIMRHLVISGEQLLNSNRQVFYRRSQTAWENKLEIAASSTSRRNSQDLIS
ncbi:MAG: hypothetical protein ACFB4I_19630 [Cyanophyceae cyanobacterium]